MTPERWQQIKIVLHEALDLPSQQRSGFLAKACSDDENLRQEVESFLALGDSEARTSFLQSSKSHITLPPGTRLGQYEVVSLLGVGGMGEVYRAHDPRLGRDVAIKVLPRAVAQDPDRLRRFEQEARAAAALNHPNILAIHDIGTDQAIPYVVSELLEGETLRECLRSGPLPVRKTLDLTLQITSGLAAAHDKSIIHRDLKPENLFLTKDGRVKILDFGLAKAMKGLGSSAMDFPRLSQQTDVGVVMGTVGYMPPEQVRGLAVDQRADIFALGAIIYEMLSGSRAFHGDTAADTINAILSRDPPPLAEINSTLAPALERIIRRCLEKNPSERFHSVRDLAFALEAISGTRDAEPVVAKGFSSREHRSVAASRHRLRQATAAAVLVLGVLAIAAVLREYWARRNENAYPTIADIQALTESGDVWRVAASPDGHYVAYVSESDDRDEIRLLQVATKQDINIVPPSGQKIPRLCFSPDGNFIYFLRRLDKVGTTQGVFRVASFGGPATLIANDASQYGLALSPDGSQLAYLNESKIGSRIVMMRVDGSDLKILATRPVKDAFWSLDWSPRGSEIAAIIAHSTGDMDLVVVSVRDGNVRNVSTNWGAAGQPAWSSDGSTLFLPGMKLSGVVMQIWSVDVRTGVSRPITSGELNYSEWSLSTNRADDLVAVVSIYRTSLWIVDSPQHPPRRVHSFEGEGWDGVAWVGSRLVTTNLTSIAVHTNDDNPVRHTSYSSIYRHIARCGVSHIVFWAESEELQAHIGYFDLDSGNAVPVGHGFDPNCTEDGAIMVYLLCDKQDQCNLASRRMPAGVPAPISSTETGLGQPRISPDGRSVLVVKEPDSKKPLEWTALIPITGGPLKPISMPLPLSSVGPHLGWLLAPGLRWSGDGTSILYSQNQNGADNIWSYPLTGGHPRQVTHFDSDGILAFDVGPGGRLLISRGKIIRDVAIIRHAR